jgi:hypothetical protein
MKDSTHNNFAISIAILALLVSGASLWLSYLKYNKNFAGSVVVHSAYLRNASIPKEAHSFELNVINTSGSNLNYVLKIDTNMGCIKGEDARPELAPCQYASQAVTLTNVGAGNNRHHHKVILEAYPGALKTNPLAYASSPGYFFEVEVIDGSDYEVLYKSKCFYSYSTDNHQFRLYQPVLDTSGRSRVIQKECRL